MNKMETRKIDMKEIYETIFKDVTKTTLGGNKMTKIKSARQQLEELAGKVAVNQYSPYGIIIGVTKHNIYVNHSIFGMIGGKIDGEEVIYQKSLGEWLEDKYLVPEKVSAEFTGFSKNEIEVVRLWAGYDYNGGKEALSQEERDGLLEEFYKDTLTQAMILINS